MTDRLIDLSEEPARLSINLDRLVIEREGRDPVTMPLVDLAALVVAHPQVRYTNAVLSGIAAAGGAFIACDTKHMPAGMLMPLTGHHLQAERFSRQAQAAAPINKRLWKQIVQAKIRAQAETLFRLYGDDKGIHGLASRVRSGDPENVEAQASRKYWPALFADPSFRRDREAEDVNSHLNYGYAVLRAIVARAICASGLHPSLGIHHHNRYDAFCLADDLMEPYRPLVDGAVAMRVRESGMPKMLDKESKAAIIGALTGRVALGGEERTLFDALARTAVSLSDVYAGKRQTLELGVALEAERVL